MEKFFFSSSGREMGLRRAWEGGWRRERGGGCTDGGRFFSHFGAHDTFFYDEVEDREVDCEDEVGEDVELAVGNNGRHSSIQSRGEIEQVVSEQ